MKSIFSRTKQFLPKLNVVNLVMGHFINIYIETLNSHLPVEQINQKCFITKTLKVSFEMVLARVKLMG